MPDEGENILLHLIDYAQIDTLLSKWSAQKCACHNGLAMATTTD